MNNDITIIDIAELTGVSVSTVSRVLNKHPDVSKKTRDKVMEAIEEYGYIPNNSARNLKRESMKAIVVVVKGFANPIFTSMLSVIEQELKKNNYAMIIEPVDPSKDEVAAAISICKEKKPRGLIFMGGNFMHTVDKVAKIDVPFVMVTITIRNEIDRNNFSSITVDDFAAGYAVGKKIIEGGHTNIAAIGGRADDISISRLRIEGYRKVIEEKGLYLGDEQIAHADEYTYESGYNAAKELLSREKFTCLFCVSDVLAFGAMRAIYDMGLAIPKDISVVGFDGIEEGKYSIPSLATMKQPEKDMAHKSVEVLLANIRSSAPHQHLFFDADFLEGESFINICK